MTAETTVPARHSRQEALAPYERLRAAHALVIGCGAVGRQVALQLAAMGVGRLELYDHDAVEEVNLGPQMYRPNQVGRNKAESTITDCGELNHDLLQFWRKEKFTRGHRKEVPAGAAVFCCVDSIETRRLVWETAWPTAHWFGDARVAGDVVRVLSAAYGGDASHYPTTLFRAGEAFRGSCTTKMSVFAASIGAGLLVSRFALWLRGQTKPCDLMLNLLSNELVDLVAEGKTN